MEQLSGVIERVTFHNPDNGFCVLRVQVRGQPEPVAVVGTCHQPIAGEYLTATGSWVIDRVHGRQFRAEEIRTAAPHTVEGIQKYLASGLIRGIGPKFARRIVEVFREKTLEVIDQSPTFLSQVRGIGPKMIEKIRASWAEQKAVRQIMVFLHSHGIGTARAVRIYKTYGDQAIDIIRNNPYRLSADIWGIGFATADELALRLGVPRDSPYRAQAAVRHVLQEAAEEGHVGYPELLVRQRAVELTHIPPETVAAAIEELRHNDEIIRDSPGRIRRQPDADLLEDWPLLRPPPVRGTDGPSAASDGAAPSRAMEAAADRTPPPRATDAAVGEETLLFLKPLFLAEQGVAHAAVRLLQPPHPLRGVDEAAALRQAEQLLGFELAPGQQAAIRAAIRHKLLVVTGGPGTGKTTLIRAITELFAARGLRLALCAPTGRAARRLAEATRRDARTIHRLLEYDPAINTFRRDRHQPLEADLVVVDETSMVDVVLMNRLLQAVPSHACVLLVGDVDQLPSVGPGAVLADLIASEVVPVVRLREIHRQAADSWIVRAAHAVHRGELPASAPTPAGDFFFIEAAEPPAILQTLRQLVTQRIPQKFGFDPRRDIQVLTPQVRTELGTLNLNRELQAVLNPSRPQTPEVRRYETVFRVGDKVMQIRNNYHREVFNGDIGWIADIDEEEQRLTVDFDGPAVSYDFAELDELQLAYACTVHKSQGSEYPAVVMPLHTQHFTMLQRHLLYTAITRGRKLVVLVGSRKALWRAVANCESQHRWSLLRNRLQRWMLRANPPAGPL